MEDQDVNIFRDHSIAYYNKLSEKENLNLAYPIFIQISLIFPIPQ